MLEIIKEMVAEVLKGFRPTYFTKDRRDTKR